MYNGYPYSSFNPGAFGAIPQASPAKGLGGILGLGKRINWDGFLTNTQRTLNVINQAMPIYNQVKPMFKNMGTVFKVIGELNKSNNTVNTTNTNVNTTNNSTNTSNDTPRTSNINNPQFFA